MPLQKLCAKCKCTKSVADFCKNTSKKAGLQSRCNDCLAEYRSANRERIIAQKRRYYAENRDRLLADKKARYPDEAEQKRAYQRAYAEADPAAAKERIQSFHAKNPDYYREFRKRNPAKVNAKEVRRKAAKLQRTPPWLTEDDHWMIEQAYDISAVRTKMFGFPWHVDHVIPLLGKRVSGLHVPLNLRVVPGVDNMSKSNKFEV